MPLRPTAASLLTGPIAAGLLAAAVPALGQPQTMRSSSPAPASDAATGVYGDAVVDQRPEWRPEWRDETGVIAAAPPPIAAPMANAANVPAYNTAVAQSDYGQSGYDRAAWENARSDWLVECRRRQGHRKAIGGAVVGGVLGGVLGNVIARRGDKTLGAVAGAAAGAAAGGVIGRGADRRASRDYCEDYLDRYMASAQQSYDQQRYGAHGVRITYQPMMVMVPMLQQTVAAAPVKRGYTETVVTEEWVPVGTPHRRAIPARRPQSDKRIRLAPDKRVPIR